MTQQDIEMLNVAWIVCALFFGVVVGLPLANLLADSFARGRKHKPPSTSTRPKVE